jgi:hypothetical protein
VQAARQQADKGLVGVMEGHAAMDMSVTQGSIWSRLTSPAGFTAISHYFVMDWFSVWKDIAGRLLIAGALGRAGPYGDGRVTLREQQRLSGLPGQRGGAQAVQARPRDGGAAAGELAGHNVGVPVARAGHQQHVRVLAVTRRRRGRGHLADVGRGLGGGGGGSGSRGDSPRVRVSSGSGA